MKSTKDWVDALRSGKFSQGFHFARMKSGRGDLYCCLGVFGAICGEDIPLGASYPSSDALNVIYEETGIEHSVFAALNDSFRADFEEIADFIEDAARAKSEGKVFTLGKAPDTEFRGKEEYVEYILGCMQ